MDGMLNFRCGNHETSYICYGFSILRFRTGVPGDKLGLQLLTNA